MTISGTKHKKRVYRTEICEGMGQTRKTYSAALIYGIKGKASIYVGDYIGMKSSPTDAILNKDGCSLFTGSENQAGDRKTRANRWTWMVHTGTDESMRLRADRDEQCR